MRTDIIKNCKLELDCEHPSLGEVTAEVEKHLCEFGDLVIDLATADGIPSSSGP